MGTKLQSSFYFKRGNETALSISPRFRLIYRGYRRRISSSLNPDLCRALLMYIVQVIRITSESLVLLRTSMDSSQSLWSPESSSPLRRWLESSLSLRQALPTSCRSSLCCSGSRELSSHSISACSERGWRCCSDPLLLVTVVVRVALSIAASAVESSSLK